MATLLAGLLILTAVSAPAQDFKVQLRDGDGRPHDLFLDTSRVYIAGAGNGRFMNVETDLGAVADIGRAAVQLLESVRKTLPEGARAFPVATEAMPAGHTEVRILSDRFLIRLEDDADPQVVAGQLGLNYDGALSFSPGLHRFSTAERDAFDTVFSVLEKGVGSPGVKEVQPDYIVDAHTRAIPDDPLFPEQWHLLNTGQFGGTPGADINVVDVWDTNRGDRVIMAIVDDGIDTIHPDFSGNLEAGLHFAWPSRTQAVDHSRSTEGHGTSVAGIAAARGFDAFGVTGVAPQSRMAAYRIIDQGATTSDFAEMFARDLEAIQIKNHSWGPTDTPPGRLGGPTAIETEAIIQSINFGRFGRGTVHVWAAGNGGNTITNVNYDGYANSVYAIAATSVDNKNGLPRHNEQGACIAVASPSRGTGAGILTTDRVGPNGYTSGDFTSGFGGTSASAPSVSGIVALMLSVRPDLNYRDVKEILIATARRTPVAGSTGEPWTPNGFGYAFNHYFGAGLVDAEAAVDLARIWPSLPPLTTAELTNNRAIVIPDAPGPPIVVPFNMEGTNLRVEHAAVTVLILHPYRGDLDIRLVSPSGMESRLNTSSINVADPNYPGWTFTTVRNWGEDSSGIWQLVIQDTIGIDTGSYVTGTLKLYGTLGGGGGSPSGSGVPRFARASSSLIGGSAPAAGAGFASGSGFAGGSGFFSPRSTTSTPATLSTNTPPASPHAELSTKVQNADPTPFSPAVSAPASASSSGPREAGDIVLSAFNVHASTQTGPTVTHDPLQLHARGRPGTKVRLAEKADWLEISPTEFALGELPRPVRFTYDSKNLSPGLHSTTVTITGRSNDAPQEVNVYFNVLDMTTQLKSSKDSVVEEVPRQDGIRFSSLDLSFRTPTALWYRAQSKAEWLACTPEEGFATGTDRAHTFDLVAYTANLPAGVHQTEIEIVAMPEGRVLKTIPVGLSVNPELPAMDQQHLPQSKPVRFKKSGLGGRRSSRDLPEKNSLSISEDTR